MIEPTLSSSDASSRRWDAIVVGAGPAGAVAARALAKRGHGVLLLDKSSFPRFKVCGGCVNRRAQHALADAGLSHLLVETGGTRVNKLVLASRCRTAQIPLPTYYGVSRATLDAALIREAIAAGVSFLPKSRVSKTFVDAGVRVVEIEKGNDGRQLRGQLLIAADGLGGVCARATTRIASGSRIGAGTLVHKVPGYFQPHTIYMACGVGGYVGCTIVENGVADIAAAFDPEYVKSRDGLADAAASVFERAGFPVWDELLTATWSGTPALTRRNVAVAAEQMLVTGDAAGYVEPFTGEGIAWAVTTGIAAGELAADALATPALDYMKEWQRQYRQIVTRRQYICYATTHALRHPRIVSGAIQIMARVPMLASPIVGTVNAKARLRKSA